MERKQILKTFEKSSNNKTRGDKVKCLKYLYPNNKKEKYRKEQLVSMLMSDPDPDILIDRKKYQDKNYIVTYYQSADYGCLRFMIYHLSGNKSSLKATINGTTIIINDITCFENNKGYGSILMEELKDFAKRNGIKEITGWLSIVDIDHEARLIHFYQKFGFKIIDNIDGNKFADIKLSIE